jgi:hypothetical protein
MAQGHGLARLTSSRALITAHALPPQSALTSPDGDGMSPPTQGYRRTRWVVVGVALLTAGMGACLRLTGVRGF